MKAESKTQKIACLNEIFYFYIRLIWFIDYYNLHQTCLLFGLTKPQRVRADSFCLDTANKNYSDKNTIKKREEEVSKFMLFSKFETVLALFLCSPWNLVWIVHCAET